MVRRRAALNKRTSFRRHQLLHLFDESDEDFTANEVALGYLEKDLQQEDPEAYEVYLMEVAEFEENPDAFDEEDEYEEDETKN
jgi:hypothetical protein